MASKSFQFPINDALNRLIQCIQTAGGKPVAVGGCVRDAVMGRAFKDVDIEVYQLPLDALQKSLDTFGSVVAVGKSFGVLKVTDPKSKQTFDVALPRTENKAGQGHRGFVVQTDQGLTFEQASSRRDFTINAMGYDFQSQKILDPHNGQKDIEDGVLRHVSSAFSEDPLRVFRGCQFAARFEFSMASETIEVCKSMRCELDALSRERIGEEFKKLVLGSKPSLGMELLQKTRALELLPEFEALIGCAQNPKWHPEGDVWVHNNMVADEAAIIVRREKLDPSEALIILLGALCHDLGKPSTSRLEEGVIKSKGHEAAGEAPTRSFFKRCLFPEALADEVVPLVREHLKPFQLYAIRDKVSNAAIRRLSRRVNIRRLCMVSEADFLGRTTPEALTRMDPSNPWLLQRAKELSVENEPPTALIQGRDLMLAGHPAGPNLGKILKAAYDAQIEGNFEDKKSALDWALKKYPVQQ